MLVTLSEETSLLNIVFVVTTLVWIVAVIACIAFLWRADSFRGKAWLMAFIAFNILPFFAAFLLPLFSSPESLPTESFGTISTLVFSTINTAAFVFILLFVYKVQAFSNASKADSNAGADNLERKSSMPPKWLSALAGIASALCVVHNIDGSILRQLAVSLTKPYAGSGGAIDYANQLSVMGTLANIVGTLYIITILLWVSWVTVIIFKLFQNRKNAALESGKS